MSQEKSPVESVNETLKMLDCILAVPENIPLFNKIQEFVEKRDFKDIENSLIPEAQNRFKDLVCYLLLKITFDISFNIHYFHNLPYKVICYVKASLFKYELQMRVLFKEILLMIVKSKRRFQFSNQALEYIIKELETLDVNYSTINFPKGIGEIEYFTGQNGILLNKDFMNSHFSVMGFIATKEEEYKRYLVENYSPELIKVISELLDVKITFDIDKKSALSSNMLSIDILELKPNFAGIGINFNEIIKIFKKKPKTVNRND